MNEENGKPQERRAEDKPGDAHLPIPIIHPTESGENGPKGAEQGYGPKPLYRVSRRRRFMRWLCEVTVAELGMFLLTLVIAGSSIYYTKYAKRQWRVMRDQLGQMQDSGKQTSQLICLYQQQVANLGEEVGQMRTLAHNAGTQSTYIGDQLQEMRKANAATETALEISQAANMTVQGVDVNTPPFATFYFSNIGNTDASNVVIQTQDHVFFPADIMESSGYDPAAELEKFRANPQKDFDEMRAWDKKHEAMYRKWGDNKTADNIHAFAEKRKNESIPKKFVPKISRGTVIGQKMNIPNAAPPTTGKVTRHVILILIDWDDILPRHMHHTNDLCYFIEGPKASPCVSPASPPK